MRAMVIRPKVTPTVVGMAEFIAARLQEDYAAARSQQAGKDISRIGLERWLLDEWLSLRREASRLRATGRVEFYDQATSWDGMARFYEPAIRILAAVWDTHPDYNPGWAPQ
jgi:hypothetical protein